MKGTGQVPGTGQSGAAKTQTGQAPNCVCVWGERIKLESLKLLKNCHVEPIVIQHMVLPLHHHLPPSWSLECHI